MGAAGALSGWLLEEFWFPAGNSCIDAPQKELPVAQVAHSEELFRNWPLGATFPAGFPQAEHRGVAQHAPGGREAVCREGGRVEVGFVVAEILPGDPGDAKSELVGRNGQEQPRLMGGVGRGTGLLNLATAHPGCAQGQPPPARVSGVPPSQGHRAQTATFTPQTTPRIKIGGGTSTPTQELLCGHSWEGGSPLGASLVGTAPMSLFLAP